MLKFLRKLICGMNLYFKDILKVVLINIIINKFSSKQYTFSICSYTNVKCFQKLLFCLDISVINFLFTVYIQNIIQTLKQLRLIRLSISI